MSYSPIFFLAGVPATVDPGIQVDGEHRQQADCASTSAHFPAVDRLQSLVNILSSRDIGYTAHLPAYRASSHGSSSAQSPEAASHNSGGETPPRKDDDLVAHDLAQRLGQLNIRQFIDGQHPIGPESLLIEVREVLSTRTRTWLTAPYNRPADFWTATVVHQLPNILSQ